MSGTGTDANPYQVADYEDLKVVCNNRTGHYYYNRTYVLVNDIDASASATENGGLGFDPIGNSSSLRFYGKFYGNGHKISGLYINRPTENTVGLFAYTYNAVIDSVILENCTINGAQYVGGLTGYANGTTIQGVHIYNSAINGTSSNVGGVCGRSLNSVLYNNSYDGTLVGKTQVGGIVGYLQSTTSSEINNCYNSAKVQSSGSQAGGIVGYAQGAATVTNSYNAGEVLGADSIGGIIGYADGTTIGSCYNKMGVSATGGYVGGIVGKVLSGDIADCYNVAEITISGKTVGGIAGEAISSQISSSYNTGDINALRICGGIAGYASYGAISVCFNTGDVVALQDHAGGIAGFLSAELVENVYSTGNVKGVTSIGGFAGQAYQGTSINYSYSIGNVSGTVYSAGFVGFTLSSYFSYSYFDKITSGYESGFSYYDTIDPDFTALNDVQMRDSNYINSLNYSIMWGIRNDSTYPALRFFDNAPFAIIDTVRLSANDYVNSFLLSELMKNDFDYETVQDSLFLKVKELSDGITDSITTLSLPLDIKNGDIIYIQYRIGEKRALYPDSLWGNRVRSILIMDNHVPFLTVDSFSTKEDSVVNIPIVIADMDSDMFSYAIVDSMKNGEIIFQNDTVIYSPNLNFFGLDSMSFAVADGYEKDTVFLFVWVEPVNDIPQVKDTVLNVVAGDTTFFPHPFYDPDDSIFTIVIEKYPSQGLVEVLSDTIQYIQQSGVAGNDTIRWFVEDNQGGISDTVSIWMTIIAQEVLTSPDTIYLSAMDNSTDSVLVSSNTSWVASSSATWLNVLSVAGNDGDSLVVVADENKQTTSREAVVTLTTSLGVTEEVVVHQEGKVQLVASNTIVESSREYNSTDSAVVTIGAIMGIAPADIADVSVSVSAKFATKNVGENLLITVSYEIEGGLSQKYLAPVDSLILTGVISPKQLYASGTLVSTSKEYDGDSDAQVSVNSLVGIELVDSSNVGFEVVAVYDDENVGVNKVITVHYTLFGTGNDNYTAPLDSIVAGASISALQLTVVNTEFESNKMFDGSPSAKVLSNGQLSGLLDLDSAKVEFVAVANYNSASVGDNKLITVNYILSGASAGNYLAPANLEVYGAKISMFITLSPLTNLQTQDEAVSVNLPYTVLTGDPVEYRVVFNNDALAAGFANGGYVMLPSSNATDSVLIQLPAGLALGTYSGSLQMRNELQVPSMMYSFDILTCIPAAWVKLYNGQVLYVENENEIFVSYQWYKDGVLIEGATSQSYVDPDGFKGSYVVIAVSADGKEYASNPKSFSQELNSSKIIAVYPNPVKETQVSTLTIVGYSDEELADAKVKVFDPNGRECYSLEGLHSINTLRFAEVGGVYLVRVNISGIEETKKVIVN